MVAVEAQERRRERVTHGRHVLLALLPLLAANLRLAANDRSGVVEDGSVLLHMH